MGNNNCYCLFGNIIYWSLLIFVSFFCSLVCQCIKLSRPDAHNFLFTLFGSATSCSIRIWFRSHAHTHSTGPAAHAHHIFPASPGPASSTIQTLYIYKCLIGMARRIRRSLYQLINVFLIFLSFFLLRTNSISFVWCIWCIWCVLQRKKKRDSNRRGRTHELTHSLLFNRIKLDMC